MFSFFKTSPPLRRILIYILTIIFFALPLSAIAGKTQIKQPLSNTTNILNVKINLLSFNPTVGDMDVRLEMFIPNQLISKNYSPKFDIYLVDLFAEGDSVFKLSSEKKFSIYDAIMPTKYRVHDAGTQFLYPFDVHHTKIAFFSEINILPNHKLPPVLKRIPIRYDCALCSFEGFDIKISHAKDFNQNFVSLNLDIHRSTAVIIFSVCITLAMWVIGAAVIILTRRIVKSNVVPDMGVLGFTSGLLFALPTVRSLQPMVPPMGVLIDYLGFLWVEFLVVISLTIIIMCWANRTKSKRLKKI